MQLQGVCCSRATSTCSFPTTETLVIASLARHSFHFFQAHNSKRRQRQSDLLHYKKMTNSNSSSPPPPPPAAPATMEELDQRSVPAWCLSFSAAMVPFCAFCYGHSRGVTTRVVERVVRSPVGVYGLFALPFLTLGMEKSIYDTVQAWQGLDPNIVPADRGGFPSGGAALPSFSLIPVRKIARKLTQAQVAEEQQQQ